MQRGASLSAPESAARPRVANLSRRLDALTATRGLAPADFLIAAAFAVLLAAQLSRHEMWRDEIHSWGLVLASPSLPALFDNLHFTGHPGLWYLILWAASFFTESPTALQAVHGAIGVALIGTIALRSPFSRLERLLLLSSYFVVFEYTVVSRAYGLGFLIALIYADMRARRADSFYLNAVLLGLLANTSLFGFLLSGAFALEYALDALLRRNSFRAALAALLPPAALYLAFIALAVATMWPSPDISWRTTGVPLSNAFDFENLFATIAGNVETILPTHPLNYWDSLAPGTVSTTSAIALPALALVYFHIFRAHRRLLIVPGLTAVASVAVAQLVYANSMRHWGINFVAFVATLWINKCWEQKRSWLVIGLLAVNAAAGIAISVQQFPAAFSQGRDTAEWIRENGFADDALVGTPDTLTSVVAQYLGKPIYFLDCNCVATYLKFDRRRDDFDESQIPQRLLTALRALEGRPVLFLRAHRLRDAELAALAGAGIAARELAAFDGASTDENFYVYRVSAAAASGMPEKPSG